MNIMIKYFITLLLALIGLPLFSGCQSVHQEESQIPWSRPASWEGGAPGIIGNPGRDRY